MMLPLLESDSILKLDLLQTLRAYFRTGGNFSHTGQKLFVHHNTVRYRLEVVERLSKMSFDSYYEMLSMQVALALLPIFFPEYRNLLPEEI